MTHEEFKIKLNEINDMIMTTLIEKNKSYGDSAIEPINIFSSQTNMEQIKARLDDKLSRIKSLVKNNRDEYFGETYDDTLKDIMGYLYLLLIARYKHKQ